MMSHNTKREIKTMFKMIQKFFAVKSTNVNPYAHMKSSVEAVVDMSATEDKYARRYYG